MLKRLLIENVALIERADIEFSEKLNVLSGETGAGKSIILDSIDFVLGAKADKAMIRSGEAFCLVRAEFTDYDARIKATLEEFDLEAEDELIISRRLTTHSLQEIGKQFGNRDHTTIVYTIKKVDNLMKTNPHERGIIEDLIRNIRAK